MVIKKIIKVLINKFRGEIDLEKLKKKGLKVGENFKMMGQCIIDPSHCWHIKIGNNVTLAPRVHILAHDSSTKLHLGYTRIANVTIGSNVFIGAGAIILPGVLIGDNVIIGAGSVVAQTIPSNSVAVGSPAKVVSSIENFIDKNKQKMNKSNTFDSNYTLRNPGFSKEQRKMMVTICERDGQVFVE